MNDLVREVFERATALRDLPSPEVCIEEDGDFCFDWDGVSLSVRPDGRIAWAALIGDYKSHGSFQWPAWAEELDHALSRLQRTP